MAARRGCLLRSGIPGRPRRHADANSNRIAVCNTHADSNTTAYSYPDRNIDCYCDPDGYGNSHSYSTANAHAEDHADPERTSDSAAETVSREVNREK